MAGHARLLVGDGSTRSLSRLRPKNSADDLVYIECFV
jgi:hypothetical protein